MGAQRTSVNIERGERNFDDDDDSRHVLCCCYCCFGGVGSGFLMGTAKTYKTLFFTLRKEALRQSKK